MQLPPDVERADDQEDGPEGKTGTVGSRPRPYVGVSGALLTSAPIPAAVCAWAFGSVAATAPVWARFVTAAAVSGLLLGGLLIPYRPRWGRVLAGAGALGPLALASPRLPDEPALALVMSITTVSALFGLWNLSGPLSIARRRRSSPVDGRVRPACGAALAFWLIAELAPGHRFREEALPIGISMAIAAAIGIHWLIRRGRRDPVRAGVVCSAFAVSALLALVTHADPWTVVGSGSIYAAVGMVFGPRAARSEFVRGTWLEPVVEHPERMFVGTFALLSLLGALFLGLPHSTASGESIGMVDATFTAVSAVCVTGLIVRDTPVDFSMFGQIVILVLIQLGGLGIMTFSTAALRLLRQRVSLRHESALASLIGAHDRSRLARSAQRILLLTFGAEALGALVLLPSFLAHGDGLGAGVWRAVFTSVSAFCNAGFALQSDSLIPYQTDPVILHVVAALIVLGGLSPLAVFAIPDLVRRPRTRPVPLQAKLSLVVTIVLLVTGLLFILATEWENTFAGMSLVDKLNNAWFQSVTLRTAGFNSVDTDALRPATLSVMLLFMFIGGSPGGTAGGIKTTTAALLILGVIQTIRGRPTIEVFGRRVRDASFRKAAVTVTVAVTGLLFAVTAILLTQAIAMPAALFEVVSALGTVGLSIGATADLDSVGKIVILLAMFTGRVGGLTLLMLMSHRRITAPSALLEEDVDAG